MPGPVVQPQLQSKVGEGRKKEEEKGREEKGGRGRGGRGRRNGRKEMLHIFSLRMRRISACPI